MDVRPVQTEKELLALECIWNELLFKSSSAHIHSTFEWLYTWWKHLGREMRLFVLVAEEEGRVTAIAPLVIRRVGKLYNNIIKFRQLCFMGVGFSDHADLIISHNREQTIRSFLKYIRDHEDKWDEVSLKQINSRSPNFPYLENGTVEKVLAEGKYRKNLAPLIEDPYLAISGSFEEYAKGLSSQFKSQLRSYQKHLRRFGGLSFSVLDMLDEKALEEIYSINKNRNQTAGRRSIFLDEAKYSFIREVLPKLSARGWLKVFILGLNKRIIGYYLTFLFENKIFAWNTSFDIEYTKYSVGRVLMYEIIKYCFENKISVFDFMVGNEEYKFRWTKTLTNNYQYFVGKNNLVTRLSVIYDGMKKQIKEFNVL